MQLPSRQAGALQQRAGFVGDRRKLLALLGSREEDGQRGAVVGRGQAAGIAMGEHALAVGEQLARRARPIARHMVAVFLVDRAGFLQQ